MSRVDELVAALARKRLWLTDAYYAGMTSYVQSLKAAAKDGVDVRLLVPNGTDIPLLRPLSRAGYRPLLESGVRIFEWNGTMLHAKTAVADAHWARVGSSNLNVSSWFGNCELDRSSKREHSHAKWNKCIFTIWRMRPKSFWTGEDACALQGSRRTARLF